MLFTVFLLVDFSKKIDSTLVFKIHKKICVTRKLKFIREKHFVERKLRVETQTKTRVWEDSSLCPEISTKMPFKNSISGEVPASNTMDVVFFRRKCLQWCKRWFFVLFMLKYQMNYAYTMMKQGITCSFHFHLLTAAKLCSFIPDYSYNNRISCHCPFFKLTQKPDDALSLHPCGCGTQPSAIPLRSPIIKDQCHKNSFSAGFQNQPTLYKY